MNFYDAIDALPFSTAEALRLIGDSYIAVTFSVGEVECLLVRTDEAAFVVPRGTEFKGMLTNGGWRDVLRDLRTFPWYSKTIGGWSHAGFLKGAAALVREELESALSKTEKLYFLGHSLGGAVALNCAAILHAKGYDVAGVFTVGCPRTFTRGTARKVAGRFPIWQFSNPGDPVPDVPMRFWGFRHCREIRTYRQWRRYSIGENHILPSYYEAFRNA